MPVTLAQYQKNAAAIFSRLGLNASIKEKVQSASAVHGVDVLVTGICYGISVNWIVECKAWKSNISKEKVLPLISLVQDAGVERGFLLSETGFQSSAIKAARGTNITLTNIDDLKATVKEYLAEAALANFASRIAKTRDRLRALKRLSNEMGSRVTPPLGRLGVLDLSIADAVKDKYPNVYKVDGEVRQAANCFSELATGIEEIISEAENIAGQCEKTA